MGGSLGLVLANIIMTEFELDIIKTLLENDTVKFYGRYVDNTLMLIKPENISKRVTRFHSFDNIHFTHEDFPEENSRFRDNQITNELSIYCKNTCTSQYTHLNSYVPCQYRISWIRKLVYRIYHICSPSKLKNKPHFIKNLASWNGYPKRITKSLISKHKDDVKSKTDESTTTA